MATISSFEDLLAWQKARCLASEIFKITGRGQLARQYAFADQMRRAAVSVSSNIAEGFERKSAPDFARFLRYAKASCAELRSQLYTALDSQALTSDEFNHLSEKAKEVGRLIGGSQSYLLTRRRRNAR